MSKYTTGEIAKLCGVSVRTVQYYDTRGILAPSALSEGGRRLYSDRDLDRMKIICFLRNLDIPIDRIKELLMEENSKEVISLLLDERESVLKQEIKQRQESADMIADIKRTLNRFEDFSTESIGDIAYIMQSRQKLKTLRWTMLFMALPINIIEIVTVVIWVKTGDPWPFILGMCVVAAIGAAISLKYFNNVSYICPKCHKVFRTGFKEMIFAGHTPYTRKLKCRSCGYHGFCVETYRVKDEE